MALLKNHTPFKESSVSELIDNTRQQVDWMLAQFVSRMRECKSSNGRP
jgi:hypothetical protein